MPVQTTAVIGHRILSGAIGVYVYCIDVRYRKYLAWVILLPM
jgi:hypothetical protein